MRAATGSILLAVAASSPLAGQAVRVRLLDQTGGRPASGALVSLRTGPDSVFSRSLTDQQGRATLAAPRAGRYLIRIDRIGYRGATAGPVEVPGGDTVAIELVVPDARLLLADLSVKSELEPVCRLTDRAGELVSTLWTEARKALVGAELSEGRLPLMEVTRFERGYAPGSAIVEETATRFRTDSIPFFAADPKRLASMGYLEQSGSGAVFYAPDARVLLSDEFLRQHCFKPVEHPDGKLIGLEFAPVPGRYRADVTGVLWLERGTAELKFLEFEYTGLSKQFRTGHDGGRVDFVRLPDGRWVVGRWRARVAWRERGGEVALVAADGTTPEGAIVVGTVYDSLAAAPLAGAIIRAAGGSYVDTTDQDGSYRLELPTDGEFAIAVEHRLLSLFGLSGTIRSAAVIRGQEVRADFAVPGVATLAEKACPGWSPADSVGILIGWSVDSAGGARPAELEIGWDGPTLLRAGHRISISERDYRVKVPSDRGGRFHVCGVPADVELRVGLPGRRAVHAAARVGSGGIAITEVRLP
jgi:hypothetical protein